MDSPNELTQRIEALNEEANGARMVTGYCWEWEVKPDSIHEIECIHTCQGLELDHVSGSS